MIPDVSLKELIGNAKDTPARLRFYLTFYRQTSDPYGMFVNLVHQGLDWCNQEMAKNKNNLQGLKENQLTTWITTPMLAMGFDARHDMNVGGHCDVTIQGDDEMLWLGEAKVFGSYTELLGGYRQLLSRYATGYPGQLCGGILIYIYQPDARHVQNEWRKYLEDSKEADQVTPDPKDDLIFYSEVAHPGTKRTLSFRHTPFVLFHRPTEQDPKPTRSR